MKKLLFFFILIYSTAQLSAQVYSNKVVGSKNEALKDSLEKSEYPYILPIWGEKATKRGYQLPYSAGVSVNYMWQESSLLIDNLSVGFNNGEMHDLDQIIRFDGSKAEANIITVRPDFWLFPFLNVYGIFGKAYTSTAIDAGVWVPDADNNWQEVYKFSTKAEFDATSFGIGATPTLGVGGGWIALDMNCAWTDVSALDKPVFTFVFGPRFGKTFKLKKEQNIAVWAGGFRVQFSSQTKGSLSLNELGVGSGPAQERVDAGIVKVDDKQVEVDTWWSGLTPAEQAKPSNQAKYETANNALASAGNFLNAVDGAINTVSNSTVQYSLDKSLENKWNFIVGAQYQLNRHYMVRSEYGFLGTRNQFLFSLQYRFGL